MLLCDRLTFSISILLFTIIRPNFNTTSSCVDTNITCVDTYTPNPSTTIPNSDDGLPAAATATRLQVIAQGRPRRRPYGRGQGGARGGTATMGELHAMNELRK